MKSPEANPMKNNIKRHCLAPDASTWPRLAIPPSEMRVSCVDGLLRVFDPLRKAHVALTPEELVRQQFVSWLVSALGYPPSLMANEVGIRLNGTSRRCDTVVYGSDGRALMIVEYKAPAVTIAQDVFDQIRRYAMVLDATCLTVTNGRTLHCCSRDGEGWSFLPHIPTYRELCGSLK